MDLKKVFPLPSKGNQDKKPSSAPSVALLVVSALCFSVVLGSVAYKISLVQKSAKQQNISITGTKGPTTDPAELVTNAMQDAQLNELVRADATSSDPFAVQPGDSLSDKVTKKIFTGYMYAEQQGGVSEESSTNVADAITSQISQSDLPAPTFSSSQVKVFVPTTKDQIRSYGNSTAGVIIKNYNIIANNNSNSNNLKGTIKIYKNIGNSIISQQTPIEMRGNQAALANSFFMMSQGMEMINLQTSDPVKALLGIKTIKEVDRSQADVLISMGAYFKKNDIIFSNDEDGSFWNQYIN